MQDSTFNAHLFKRILARLRDLNYILTSPPVVALPCSRVMTFHEASVVLLRTHLHESGPGTFWRLHLRWEMQIFERKLERLGSFPREPPLSWASACQFLTLPRYSRAMQGWKAALEAASQGAAVRTCIRQGWRGAKRCVPSITLLRRRFIFEFSSLFDFQHCYYHYFVFELTN